LIGMQAMLGQEPPIHLRSTTDSSPSELRHVPGDELAAGPALARHRHVDNVGVDSPAIFRRVTHVEAQVATHLENYKASGAELVMGSGRFVAPKTIEVKSTRRRPGIH
jgi:hypothetical protein